MQNKRQQQQQQKPTNSLLLHQLNFLAFYHSMNHEYFNSEFFPFLLHWSTAFKHWPGFVPTPMLASHIFFVVVVHLEVQICCLIIMKLNFFEQAFYLFIILKLDISIGENSWKRDSCMKLSLSELHNSYCIT